MYVRLAFAVAAHLETEILFVDEVLAVGDAEFQRQCLDKMQSVVRDGRTDPVRQPQHGGGQVALPARRCCSRAAAWSAMAASTMSSTATCPAGGRRTTRGSCHQTLPRSGTGEARLRRILIRDQSIDAVSQIYLGDPFAVEMEFDVTAPLRDVVVGVGISSLDGVRVATAYHIDGAGTPWSFAPGRHRVVVEMQIVLLPRRYTLDVVITRTDGYEIDFVQRVLDFTAIGVARSGDDHFPWATVHGYVRPASRWLPPEPVGKD